MKRTPHISFRRRSRRKNIAYLSSDRSRGRECRIPRSGDTQGRKSASQGANSQAYAPSEASGILFFNSIQIKSKTTFFFISLWFSSKVAWAAVSWIVDTEPGFICLRRIRMIRTIPSTELLAVFKHFIGTCKTSGIKVIIYINYL